MYAAVTEQTEAFLLYSPDLDQSRRTRLNLTIDGAGVLQGKLNPVHLDKLSALASTVELFKANQFCDKEGDL
jgi:hypothetical protein